MTEPDDARRLDAPAVALHDVVAVLGGFPVLAGASIRVERGEIVLLDQITADARGWSAHNAYMNGLKQVAARAVRAMNDLAE